MKVSVLIPVYGVERYIERCAKSLLEQSYKDIEYVFVDDCTTDRSIEVLKSVIGCYAWRAEQVRIIRHEHNRGLAAARQTAIEASTGDALLFVDSDDYIDCDAIERLVSQMQASGADVVDGGYCIVQGGQVTRRYFPCRKSLRSYLKIVLCQNVELNAIVGRLIKRSLIVDNKISFVQGIDYGEDFSFLPRVLKTAQRSWVDDCLYYYAIDHSESYTNNITTKNAISFLKAQQLVGEFMLSQPGWDEYRLATEIGWVNVWRFAWRFNVDKALVEQHFKLKPASLATRILNAMMRNKRLPYKLANFIYLAMRRIYLTFAVH